jgi:hypothetical protein
MSKKQEAREEAADRLSEINEEIQTLIDEISGVVKVDKEIEKQMKGYITNLQTAFNGSAGSYTLQDAECDLREE